MFKRNIKKICILVFVTFFLTSCSIIKTNSFKEDDIEVHFINVGQGDSILIHVNKENVLIDSGPKEAASSLISYLKKHKISTINYLIATHPHEDHIGNMDLIIKKFNIKSFYSPKVISSGKTYENMIDALKSKKLKINTLKSGNTSINLGKDTSVTVLAPEAINPKDKSNLNNYSAVILIKYKHVSFLFTGDAEKESEKNILTNYPNIKADVLKIGHHGSDSSTTESFLKAVSPSVAVISVGKDNSYGHPHKSTLNLLNKYNIKCLRTDEDGNIIISSDGNDLKIIKK